MAQQKQQEQDLNQLLKVRREKLADLQGTADFLYDSGIITKSLNIADYVDETFSKNIQ